MFSALKTMLKEKIYAHYYVADQVILRNMIRKLDGLDKHEIDFINNRASVDFVIYNKQDKRCVLAIEVDGFEYHENNPKQLERDALKNTILNKYGIPILRLPTNGSEEMNKICAKLNEIEIMQDKKLPN